ncbi:hypothetical protein [Psychromonas sp. MME2]|uniref:hypothetical protein n=1 Tax=Psychromonas sp. MME2 TaxID=3231033 RepID=UPI00339C1C4A
MASMTHQQRAQHYFERLLKAGNRKAELERILNDLNGLVFASTNKPLDKDTKNKILDELEKLVKSTPAFEDIDESRIYTNVQKSTSASDNSEILDVISAMKDQ